MLQVKIKRSAERDERFFTALENGHGVVAAAEAAGYERRTVYRWKKDNPDFATRWSAALEMALDLLEEEADRRGREGWDEPVFFHGAQVGSKHKYSDALLLARLKAVRPELYNSEHVKRPRAPVREQQVDFICFDTLDYVREMLAAGTLSEEQLPQGLREQVQNRPTAYDETRARQMERARSRSGTGTL
jgi:hypothetical protein